MHHSPINLLSFTAYAVYGVNNPDLITNQLLDREEELFSLFNEEFNSYLPSIRYAGLDMYTQKDALTLVKHCANVVGYTSFTF